jgi:hypothetical protein
LHSGRKVQLILNGVAPRLVLGVLGGDLSFEVSLSCREAASPSRGAFRNPGLAG